MLHMATFADFSPRARLQNLLAAINLRVRMCKKGI
jgi:hypothetical protein